MDYKEIISGYTGIPGGIIEAFHAVQEEYGYLPEIAISEAARVFKVPPAEAYGVATFYSMFSIKPRGKYVVRVCQSAPCHVAGATEVVAALEKELGIRMGDTTPDGLFSLEFTECIGQCQANPVISINGQPYQGVSPAKVSGIIAAVREKHAGGGS